MFRGTAKSQLFFSGYDKKHMSFEARQKEQNGFFLSIAGFILVVEHGEHLSLKLRIHPADAAGFTLFVRKWKVVELIFSENVVVLLQLLG